MNTRTTTATAATAATAVLAAAILLTACSGGPGTAEESASPSAGSAGAFKIGEEARNGGAVVKISKVHEADGILMDTGTKSAGAKEKYVALETVVRNDTESGMDLMCSLPVVSRLIDDQGRRYDAIGDLDEIPGNPECDEKLAPGAKDQMVFAYRVPKSAKITAWEFSEPGRGSGHETGRKPSTIDLSGTSPT